MNKNSKVLALKYRPQVFDDLIGQEIIVDTIKNSISLGKIPNAFLFTGIRGIGKTTIARVLAKSLNCTKKGKNNCKVDCCNNGIEISESRHNFLSSARRVNTVRQQKNCMGVATRIGVAKKSVLASQHVSASPKKHDWPRETYSRRRQNVWASQKVSASKKMYWRRSQIEKRR